MATKDIIKLEDGDNDGWHDDDCNGDSIVADNVFMIVVLLMLKL